MNIIIALIIFSIIILFHELGHFLLAKANGIKVNEFSLGLGPTLFGVTRGETKYSIKLLPFGGACMMEGEDGESQDAKSFNSKSVWARISVVAAGPVFNFIMAWVFALIVMGSVGFDRPVLSSVREGFPAAEAGLMEGDEIISMNGSRTHFFREVSQYSLFHPGKDVGGHSRNQYHLCVGYGGKQIVHIPHFFSKGLAMEQISADEEKLYVFLPHILNDLLKGFPNFVFPPFTPGIPRIRSRPQMHICQMDKTHTILLSKY